MTKILGLGETLFLILGLLMVFGIYLAMIIGGLLKNSKILRQANQAPYRKERKKQLADNPANESVDYH